MNSVKMDMSTSRCTTLHITVSTTMSPTHTATTATHQSLRVARHESRREAVRELRERCWRQAQAVDEHGVHEGGARGDADPQHEVLRYRLCAFTTRQSYRLSTIARHNARK